MAIRVSDQGMYDYGKRAFLREKPISENLKALNNEPPIKNENSYQGAEAMKNYNSVNFRATAPRDLTTKNIKPADGPILYFVDKNEEEFMARAVIINGDTKAFAISNVKNPSQALLMNEKVFKEYMLENLPEVKSMVPKYIELSDKYSQEEIVDILKTVGTYKESPFENEYDITYYTESETLVINNRNRTNDTTEVNKDGSVKHRGSWHNKEVAPEGSFIFIVEEAIERLDDED